jgi:sirohydrochlorin cobaltochelatase
MNRDIAVILCSHGVNGAPGAATDHAARLRERGLFADVAAACLNGTPAIGAAIDAASVSRIVVVPFLMAAGRAFNTTLPERIAQVRHPERVSLAEPVGTHPDVTGLIETKAMALAAARGWAVVDVQLVIAAHGTARDPESGIAARAHAARIARNRRFAAVEAGFLDEAPSIEGLLAGRTVPYAIGVGLFADAGPHGGSDAERPFRNDPGAAYAGPVGPDPALADIVLKRAQEAI